MSGIFCLCTAPIRALCGPPDDAVAEEVFSSGREGSAEGSVSAALPLRTFTTSHSSFPPPVAPHNTVASMCEDEPFDSAPLDPTGKWAAHTTATERVNGDSLHESAMHVSDRRALPRSAPACRMVRVKLVKAIPDDKFGFVNQPPSCGEMGTGDPTCLEIVTIVSGQLLDKWNKRQTDGTRVTEGSYITA
ncbi:mannosyltransferase, partial [Perkinsus olseni]